jgi:hypothetical protein
MKAVLELELPESCSACSLRFIHTGYNDNEKIGCGYLNTDVTEYSDCRHHDCPLKTLECVGYEDYIRIGNESDALRLLEEMVDKCKIQPRPDYNDMEKGMFKIVEICHSYFLPRLEAVKDALERNII